MRALAPVALVLVLVLAGCGGGKKAQERHAVNAYFAAVNRVHDRYATAFRLANIAYTGFSAKRRPPREATQLRSAAAAIAAAGDAVAAIVPPPQAAGIHRDLVLLYRSEARFAEQLRKLDAFLPAARKEILVLRASSRALRAKVGSTSSVAGRATALDRYSVRVVGIADRLSALSPPTVLQAWRAAQVAWLRSVGPTAGQLAAALRVRDVVASSVLSQRLRLQLGRPPTTTRAERDAAVAFNRRLVEMAKLSRRIDKQRAALERQLG